MSDRRDSTTAPSSGHAVNSRRPLRVALLRGDDYHNEHLDRLLRSRFSVVVTAVEPGAAQRRALRRWGKWRDAIAAEYHYLRRTVCGLNRFRRDFFAQRLLTGACSPPNIQVVNAINDPLVGRLVAEARPDICVISCVTILAQSTIDDIGVDIINVHGGHLPDYRGCHCFFFALYEGNYDKIGSTIHYVDKGIDTGDIVEIVRPAIEPTDNAESLYCKAERLAAKRLCHWLGLLESGRDVPRARQSFRGRLCLRRNRGPQHDIIFWVRRLLGRVRLPHVRESEQWNRQEIASTPSFDGNPKADAP